MKAARTRALNRKHAGTSKHSTTAKHTPTARKRATAHAQAAHRTAAQVKAAKVRALSPGAISCCSASAVGRSLWLAGWPVVGADVLELHWRATGGVDTAVSIPSVLEAALWHGLAGVRPRGFERVALADLDTVLATQAPESLVGEFAGVLAGIGPVGGHPAAEEPEVIHLLTDGGIDGVGISGIGEHQRGQVHPASVILGLDLPEAPHAACLDPSGSVWSWGALYDLTAEAVVEEAWRVVWPSWL